MWYGKGPGVDRCGDVLRHGNAHGSSTHGGVLLCAGDDHVASSSTLPHQTDHMFASVMSPLLYPAHVQDILDFGLLGWAMSRYSGCWVGFKSVAEVVESAASVSIDANRLEINLPDDFEMPPGGLNVRLSEDRMATEERLQRHMVYAALAFARANRIDRTMIEAKKARLGIIATGKAYLDVRQALDDLGISEKQAREIGLRIYKVGMVWPLEKEGVRKFAEGGWQARRI